MQATGDFALIRQLNEYLGRELGRRPNGSPIFRWEWSENLFWPAFATGRTTQVQKVVDLPLIGGGAERVNVTEVVPEYRRERQVRQSDTWYVTKWLSAEHLIFGWFGGHQAQLTDGDFEKFESRRPDETILREMWQSRFPGADFPANGWRVPTNASLPRSPGEPREPNWADTRHFVVQVKHQASQNFDQAMREWEAADDAKNAAQEALIGEECRDMFTAFLNPNPGKRGGFVSFPWSRQDRLR